MDLASGQVITHGHVTEIPISNAIIAAVEEMGYKQGFKRVSNLQIVLASLS